MLVLIITVALIGLSLVYYHLTVGKYQKAVNKIPGPSVIPILGNAHMVGRTPHEILHNLLKWWRQYGQNKFRIWIGFEAFLFISDPKDIENILSSTQILKKSTIYNLLHPWLGQGLLTSYGPLWHSHRKMITPSFHFKILVDFLETMNTNSSKFIKKLEKVYQGDVIYDFQKLVCYCTLDVICETAMGVGINAMDDSDSEVVKAFQYMCYSVEMRSFSTFKKNPFLFKFTPEYPKYKHALDTLSTFTMDVILKRREAMKADTKEGDTNVDLNDSINVRRKQAFLDTLLTSTIAGRPLTDKEIFEEVSTFMFEGHDTTSSGITFLIHLLSRHQEVQNKVFEEQMQIFNEDMTAQPSYNDLQEMKYLDMVIKEAQRLYPSVPIVARCTEGSYNMNGLTIPDATTVNLFIIGMGYNDKYFPDPYKFDPERFNPDTRVKANPYEYVPFSAGPRNCIGQKFAMMEMKSIIAKIVRAFKILPPEDGLCSKDGYEPKEPQNKYDPILSLVLTLKAENGVHIRLKKRSP